MTKPLRRNAPLAAAAASLAAAATLAALAVLAAPAARLHAQEVAEGERPTVFLDCATRQCNATYFRTELPWVNWARQPQDADVHLIMTSQATGAGGREYQLDFIGIGDYVYEHQMSYSTPPTNTERETLDGITHALGIGVLHFGTTNGFFEEPDEFYELVEDVVTESEEVDPTERVFTDEEVEDPWNFWVFRLGGNTEVNGEQTRHTTQIRANASASRVTSKWKMNFRGDFNINRREIDLPDNGTFSDERTDWGVSELIAYALAAHWSVGVQGEVRKITRFNQKFRWEVTPALEYSVFPYEEATRRAFTFQYRIGPAYREYIEETVYGWLSETRWEQAMEVEFSQRQPWGQRLGQNQRIALHLQPRTVHGVAPHRLELPRVPGAEPQCRRGGRLGQRPDLSVRAGRHRRRSASQPPAARPGLQLRSPGRLFLPVRIGLQQRGQQPVPGELVAVGRRAHGRRGAAWRAPSSPTPPGPAASTPP